MESKRYMVKVTIDGEYLESLGWTEPRNFYARKFIYKKFENETDEDHEARLSKDVIFRKIFEAYRKTSNNKRKYSSLELRELLKDKLETAVVVEDLML